MHEGSLVFHREFGRGLIISCSLYTLSNKKGFNAKVRFKSGKIKEFGKSNKFITEFLHHIKRR